MNARGRRFFALLTVSTMALVAAACGDDAPADGTTDQEVATGYVCPAGSYCIDEDGGTHGNSGLLDLA